MTDFNGEDRIHEIRERSRILGREKRFFIVTPAGGGPRPACYLLHGWGGNASSYLSHPRIRELLLAVPFYTVLPESFRRWFINDASGGKYEDYLVKELIPLVDERFATQASRETRAIGGFSMGGCAAFLAAARHPNAFDIVFSHAGAFDAPRRDGDPYQELREDPLCLMPRETDHVRVWGPPGSKVRAEYDPYRVLKYSSLKRLRIYLDVCRDDYPRMIEMNRSFHQALKDANVRHEYHEWPGRHDMDFVAAALPHSMKFIERTLFPTPAALYPETNP